MNNMNDILKNEESPTWKLPENVTISTTDGKYTIGVGNKFSISPPESPSKKHSHYFKDVSHLNEIDVYRVIELFGVVDPCLAHALKKLLVTGGRDGNKSKEQDVRDVIASCNRWLEMQAENKK